MHNVLALESSRAVSQTAPSPPTLIVSNICLAVGRSSGSSDRHWIMRAAISGGHSEGSMSLIWPRTGICRGSTWVTGGNQTTGEWQQVLDWAQNEVGVRGLRGVGHLDMGVHG